MNIDKIIFYYPSKITGGTEYLFLRCADYLAEHQQKYKIFIVDYIDGFYRNNSKSKNIDFFNYKKGTKIDVPDGSCVIVQLNVIGLFYELFDFNNKKSFVLFWALHFKNLSSFILFEKINTYVLFKCERRRLGKEIAFLAEKNIIKFMSQVAYVIMTRDYYQSPKQLSWLPNIAPVNNLRKEPLYTRISQTVVRFCWLGRLDDEKALNIETYMNELEAMSSYMQLSLSVIGLGSAETYLKKKSKKYTYPIYFVGEIRGEELDRFISQYTEIGLASGTSALEFSLRGKPVIYEWLLDRVYLAGERKEYYLPFENIVERYDSNYRIYRKNQGTFEFKVKQILSNYELISRNCYDYVKQYTAEKCCAKLVENIESVIKEDPETLIKHIDNTNKLLNLGRRRKNIIKKMCLLNRFQ